jgi:hypothetical protein
MIDMIAIGQSAVRRTAAVVGGPVRGPNAVRRSDATRATFRTVHRSAGPAA